MGLVFLVLIEMACSFGKITAQHVPSNSLSNTAVSLSFSDFQNRYPEEKAIFLERRKTLWIDYLPQKDSLYIVAEHHTRMLHLKFQSQAYANEVIPFSQYQTILAKEAYTLLPQKDGSKIKKSVNHFEQRDVVSADVFYNDAKELTFIFPQVIAGAETVLTYREHIKEPRFLGSFFWTSYAKTQKAAFTIYVDKRVSLEVVDFHLQPYQVRKDSKSDKKYHIYHFEAENLPKFSQDKSAPALRYYEPHQIPYVSRVEEKPFLASTRDLYQWYYGFISKVDSKAAYRDLKDLADSLTLGARNERQKAEMIFRWVNTQIQYIAFEDGLRGFVPAAPASVLYKRYGDCKDMSSLLVGLLRAVGLEAYFAWIGSRDLPYRYQNLPTPAVDNHMIAVLMLEGDTLFLDATGKTDDFGKPTSFIQGKEALVAKSPTEFQVLTLPILEKSQNQIYDSAYLKLDLSQRTLSGEAQVYYKGYPKDLLAPLVRNATKGEEKEALRKLLNPKQEHLQLLNYQVSRDSLLRIQYQYLLPQYVQILQNEIYLNLHLNPVWRSTEIDTLRRSPISSHYHFEETHLYILELPKGYLLRHVPENQSYKGDFFGYEIRYERRKESLLLFHRVYGSYLLLEKARFQEWNLMIEMLNDAYRQNIILAR